MWRTPRQERDTLLYAVAVGMGRDPHLQVIRLTGLAREAAQTPYVVRRAALTTRAILEMDAGKSVHDAHADGLAREVRCVNMHRFVLTPTHTSTQSPACTG